LAFYASSLLYCYNDLLGLTLHYKLSEFHLTFWPCKHQQLLKLHIFTPFGPQIR